MTGAQGVKSLCERSLLRNVICWRGSRREHAVGLTFDDGPTAEFTPQVLAILEQLNVRGTFFVEGHRAERLPALVRRMAEAGHEIGNHGYRHDGEALVSQARKCDRALKACGIRTRLFRPPMGRIGSGDLLRLTLLGYRTVLWSVDSHDSMRVEGKWAGALPDYAAVGPGDIVLMHDDNRLCLEELPGLVRSLAARGLTSVTLRRLLSGHRSMR